jgi:hypothetical protein
MRLLKAREHNNDAGSRKISVVAGITAPLRG